MSFAVTFCACKVYIVPEAEEVEEGEAEDDELCAHVTGANAQQHRNELIVNSMTGVNIHRYLQYVLRKLDSCSTSEMWKSVSATRAGRAGRYLLGALDPVVTIPKASNSSSSELWWFVRCQLFKLISLLEEEGGDELLSILPLGSICVVFLSADREVSVIGRGTKL